MTGDSEALQEKPEEKSARRPAAEPLSRPTFLTEYWPMEMLQPFDPKNELCIPVLSKADAVKLRSDIAENGLQHPIDIVIAPDGTGLVVAGNERMAAIEELGWKHVDVRIRDDLDTWEKQAAYAIRDNLVRRQMNPSQLAAQVLVLEKIMGGKVPREELAKESHVSMQVVAQREEVGHAVADTPEVKAVQEAADAGQVPLAAAARIVALPRQDRVRVSEAIAAAEPEERARVAEREAPPDVGRRETKREMPASKEQRDAKTMSIKLALDQMEQTLGADRDLDVTTVEWMVAVQRQSLEKMPLYALENVTQYVGAQLEVIAKSMGKD